MAVDRPKRPRRGERVLLCVTLLGWCLWAGGTAIASDGGDTGMAPAFSAREGLDLAAAAARAWEGDAALVYLENDEPLDAEGKAPRWSYLFHSAARDEGRVYSIRDGAIVVAVDLDFVFESPPVPGTWVDSDVALASADEGGGREYRRKFGGTPSTLLLMRGEPREGGSDPAAWTVVYTSSKAPSLYVQVDARTGEVKRTWS